MKNYKKSTPLIPRQRGRFTSLPRQLTTPQGQWTWDIRKINAGTYIFSASANGINMGSGKIVIFH